MAAAKRIARDVELYLQKHGIDLKARGSGTVVAVADEKWTGTWTVQVHLPGFTGVLQRSAAKREEETELAVTALRASVDPSDLVRSWRS